MLKRIIFILFYLEIYFRKFYPLILYQTILSFYNPGQETYENIVGKGKNTGMILHVEKYDLLFTHKTNDQALPVHFYRCGSD